MGEEIAFCHTHRKKKYIYADGQKLVGLKNGLWWLFTYTSKYENKDDYNICKSKQSFFKCSLWNVDTSR